MQMHYIGTVDACLDNSEQGVTYSLKTLYPRGIYINKTHPPILVARRNIATPSHDRHIHSHGRKPWIKPLAVGFHPSRHIGNASCA